MDSITQALLGATTAQAGFRQKIGRDATWVAAAAAYSPDLDIFAGTFFRWAGNHDPFIGLLTHRAITHSLLVIPLIALLFAGPWYGLRRLWHRRRRRRTEGDASPPPSFGWLFACCLVAAATHATLDWFTSYGTQLLSPITDARYALHAVGIIDFIYTPLLIVTLLTCWIVRKVRRNPQRLTVAIGVAGLVLSTGYLFAGLALRSRAIDQALALHRPQTVLSAEAYPTIGTIFLWRTVIETPDEWIVTRVHHLSDGDEPPRFTRIAKVDHPLIDEARQTRGYRIYNWFALGQLRPEVDAGGRVTLIRFHDMRYSLSTDSGESLWPLEVRIGPGGEVLSAERSHARREAGMGEFAARIWKDIWDF